MSFFNDKEHEVGDKVWIANGTDAGSWGKVVYKSERGWLGYPSMRHYIVEIETPIDPYLEIRADHCVWDHNIHSLETKPV